MYTVKSNELKYFEQILTGIAVFYSIRLTIHQMCLFYFINSAANSNPFITMHTDLLVTFALDLLSTTT